MNMNATNGSSQLKLIIGLIYGLTFPLYPVDHQNSAVSLANLLEGWAAKHVMR